MNPRRRRRLRAQASCRQGKGTTRPCLAEAKDQIQDRLADEETLSRALPRQPAGRRTRTTA